jgi:hypothetical protein
MVMEMRTLKSFANCGMAKKQETRREKESHAELKEEREKECGHKAKRADLADPQPI